MSDFIASFQQNFIDESRYLYLLQGLGTTLLITAFAAIIGIILGFLVAVIRSTYDQTGKMKFLNAICNIYLTVIRGTGAYVAEIVRSGIMSIDRGQLEAGRSLGFSYASTMWYIIMPQAFKNVLPALANEFIVLLKETSICGYIGLMDLTRGGDIIRSRTYNAFMPLLAVALIYLILVMILSALVRQLERRLRNSER